MAMGLLCRAWNARAFRLRLGVFALLAAATLAAIPAQARFTQQGNKLVGVDLSSRLVARQGYSVALSGDGNTAIVGGASGDSVGGDADVAAWVFTFSFGTWRQQGNTLVGTGGVGDAPEGASVALSADGNTAIVAAPSDDNGIGAAWVFTRDSDGVWTQQGDKLVGTGALGPAQQGFSVALSGDGNTAIVGGPADNGGAGAAWVFTRDGSGMWTQQGNKLVGTGAVGSQPPQQGFSVALSGDGNTAIVGGPGDNEALPGATWVFTRDGSGMWTQQGTKLVGVGAVGPTGQGASVALSVDGNTALVGGPGDGSFAGATWVFTRDGSGMWTQQGNKLVGTGAVGPAQQGRSVALSGNGNIAIVGGPFDNSDTGAAWVFRRNRAGVWSELNRAKLVGTGAVGSEPPLQGFSVALSGDGNTAMVGGFQDNDLAGAVWVFGRPAVTEVFPDAGTVDGGTNVLILGNNLRDVTGVTFGGVPATDVIEVDPGAVFATTPAHRGGRVRVDVTTRTGTGRARRAYTYQKHPTVTSLTSSVNPSSLGQRVRFRAKVTTDGGAPASGSVTFKAVTDGNRQTLGTVALNRNGVARFSTDALARGRHRIKAIFQRNGRFQRSADRLRQRVRK